MVVLSDDIWDKLENQNHKDIDTTIGGPAMILNYDQDRYYLTYGSRILNAWAVSSMSASLDKI